MLFYGLYPPCILRVRDRTLDPRPRAVLRGPTRDLEFHAGFNAASCYVWDPEFRVDFNTGYGIPCGVPCAVPGTSNECGGSTYDPLSRREHELREGCNGGPWLSYGVLTSMRESVHLIRNSIRVAMLDTGWRPGLDSHVGINAVVRGSVRAP